MDIRQFADRMDELMKEAYHATRLKSRRAACGMSQSELAADSSAALRQIQLFEQRQRNINNAAAITLLHLSRFLNCRMEDLIEPYSLQFPPVIRLTSTRHDRIHKPQHGSVTDNVRPRVHPFRRLDSIVIRLCRPDHPAAAGIADRQTDHHSPPAPPLHS